MDSPLFAKEKECKLKVLISSCVAGENVRWNSTNKKDESLIQWAEREGITLIPVCPENSLFGTPRSPIRLEKIEDKIVAHFKGLNVFEDLSRECDKISDNFKDVVGFIGIARSPTYGISVGVKNLGKISDQLRSKSLGEVWVVSSNANGTKKRLTMCPWLRRHLVRERHPDS